MLTLFVVGAATFLLVSFLDGYWLNGTYGYLVIAGLIPCGFLLYLTGRVLWEHAICGFPVIGFGADGFHYLRLGQNFVRISEVKDVELYKNGLFASLRFLAGNGDELQRYPLFLSSANGPMVLKRIKRLVG